jgi:hypothetical protein
MHMVCNGLKIQVVQLGPDFLMLEEADDFEGPGKLFYLWMARRNAAMSSCSVDPRGTKKQSRSCTNCVRSPPICKKLDNYP